MNGLCGLYLFIFLEYSQMLVCFEKLKIKNIYFPKPFFLNDHKYFLKYGYKSNIGNHYSLFWFLSALNAFFCFLKNTINGTKIYQKIDLISNFLSFLDWVGISNFYGKYSYHNKKKKRGNVTVEHCIYLTWENRVKWKNIN